MATLIPILAALLAFAISYYACELMKRTGVTDAPDGKRKTQRAPVPRLGGVGVMLAIAIVFALLALTYGLLPITGGSDWLPGPAPVTAIALAASVLLAGVGAWDDIHNLAPSTKLGFIAIICIVAPMLGVAAPSLDSPFGTLTLTAAMVAGSALWLIVFSNAANFMDGSNGLSLGSLAVMFAGLGACQAAEAGGVFPAGLLVIIAAIGAFLVHNMRGTLYAGDAGAFGLGGLFATLALISGLSIWSVATLALPFLVDVLLTLILRARRRDPWFEAHTDHAYQALRRTGWSHLDVAVLWWSLSAACAVAAAIGVSGGGALPFILFWLIAIPLSVCWFAVLQKTRDHLPGSVGG